MGHDRQKADCWKQDKENPAEARVKPGQAGVKPKWAGMGPGPCGKPQQYKKTRSLERHGPGWDPAPAGNLNKIKKRDRWNITGRNGTRPCGKYLQNKKTRPLERHGPGWDPAPAGNLNKIKNAIVGTSRAGMGPGPYGKSPQNKKNHDRRGDLPRSPKTTTIYFANSVQ